MSADNDVKNAIEDLIKQNHVVIFSKTTCPFCSKVSFFSFMNLLQIL